MAGPVRFLGSASPWRALAFAALTLIAAPLVLLTLVPCAVALLVPSGRAAVARGCSRLLGAHANLADPSLGRRLTGPGTRSELWGTLGAVLAAALVFAPLAFLLLVVGGTAVAVMAAAPWLVRRDPIAVFDWTASTPEEGLLLCALAVPAAVLLLYGAAGLSLVQTAVYRSLSVRAAEQEAEELRVSRDLLLAAFDTERCRIEGMLHDGVQHRLVALAMTLGLAEASAEGPDARRQFAEAHRQADEALADLRRTIRGILPRALAERGLEPAVQDLAAEFPLPVTVVLEGAAALSSRAAEVGYFVVSESLGNSLKHARASRCAVVGGRDGERWTLRVEDDGVGGAAVRQGGGLDGLRLRASAVGGAVRVEDRADGGTAVTFDCPLEAEALR